MAARTEQLAGGLTLLLGIATAGETFPAINSTMAAPFEEGDIAAGLIEGSHTAMAYGVAAVPIIGPFVLYGNGIYDQAAAIDSYNRTVTNCAGSVKIP